MNKHSREHSFDIRHKSSEISKINNGMSETVQVVANNIYKEFERLITFYGSDVVEYLMPLIVSVLENLEELYRIKQSNELEMELLKEDNCALNSQYEKEKVYKKQAEERALNLEYTYDEEKNLLKEKLLTTESTNRLLEVKARNSTETIARLEDKVQTLKTENQKLYERYTEILKSHAEQLNRIQCDVYREISPAPLVFQSRGEKAMNKQKARVSIHSDDSRSKTAHVQSATVTTNMFIERFYHLDEAPQSTLTSNYISNEAEVMSDILANDQWLADFQGGNESDLIPILGLRNPSNFDTSTGIFMDNIDNGDRINEDHSLEINTVDSDTEITDDEFGIGKEIESLIRENQELVATKNALNVVKDDLINRLDLMTNENDVLREDVSQHFNREADLKAKVVHLEHELKACKEELLKFKDSQSVQIKPDPLLCLEQKSFNRSEMAILLQEKNYYKEKLIELQDAVVYKEMCRVKKQFPELKESPKPVKTNNSSIWNLFSKLSKSTKSKSPNQRTSITGNQPDITYDVIALDMLHPDIINKIAES